MTEVPSIQWFPGHMTRTKRMIEKEIRLVDVVAELLDARIPSASANPDLPKMIGGKPRLILLNKADLANEKITQQWVSYFREKGIQTLAIDARSGRNINQISGAIEKTIQAERERWQEKGMIGRTVRVMVAGIPNVGKTSLMNRLSGGKKARVEDRPGVTRGKQWVKTTDGIEILDTPGILWPKFEDPEVGKKLALTGAVKDQVVDTETLAMNFLEMIAETSPELLESRYGLETVADLDGYDLLEEIGHKRGMLQTGGVVNLERAAIMVLDEFRGGKLGRISLEKP